MAVTWNPSDKDAGVTLSGGDLTAAWASNSSSVVRCTNSESAGKWYFEASVVANPGNAYIGVGNGSMVLNSGIGQTANGLGYRMDGAVRKGASTLATVATYTTGDVIGVAFDVTSGTVDFYKNNTLVYSASGADVPTGALYPAVSGAGAPFATNVTANFGTSGFTYTPPSGYSAIVDLVLAVTMDGGVSVGGEASIILLPFETVMDGGVIVGGEAGIELVSSTAAQSSATCELIQASGTATQSPVGYSAVDRPFVQASGVAGTYTIPQLPYPTATGVAYSGAISVYATPGQLPYPVATGNVWPTAESQYSRPYVVASGVALSGALGSSSAAREQVTASSTALAAALGTSSAVLLMPVATGTAYMGSGATYSAVVMHTQSQALSTYGNFVFNSFARFNGTILAGGDLGLFTLGGATDDGTAIQSAARTGLSDLGTSYRKRVERVYVGYRSSADMTLRVRTDETQVRDYLVPSNGYSGLRGTHVRLGRGLEARYWGWEVRNNNGSDFTLDMLELKPTKLKRRVGGRDA